MTYLIIALAIFVGIYLIRWIREGYEPVKHGNLSPHALYRLLDALYFRGFSDGTMTVTVPRHGELTVCKHIVEDNDVRLQTIIVEPSIRFVAESIATELGIRRGLSGTPTYRIDSESMMIDFGNDLRSCEQFIRSVARHVWQTDLEQEGYAELRNVAVGDYRIGWTK